MRFSVALFAMFLGAFFSGLIAAGPATAANLPPRVRVGPANPGFEAGGGAVPAGWAVSANGGLAEAVANLAHGGARSLRFEHATAASTTAESEPIALRVGRIYRLSAWIRTERAEADPLARYPTAVAATVSMASFPFTENAPPVGTTREWTRTERLFVATRGQDRVRLHLGRNGAASGSAWFDDVAVEEVSDVTELVPLDRVRWLGDAYRYDDRGWIFVHIEGEPYPRGYQFGYLVADELAAYAQKLAIQQDGKDAKAGWNELRLLADSLMLRGFDEEYLAEMKGIADGAAKGGAKIDGRPVDLLDVVTLNSAVDLGQLQGALRSTPNALSGKSFLSAEDEMKVPDDRHKCSALAATGPATADGRVVFGQLFMWSGYTGVHFNVVLDVVPARGHRLVFQTFPGGIHSGTDFYMNGAGILIGETTVAQTPFDPSGTPQSNRVRKAAQYASSIDEVAAILAARNNGLYTNDWPIADVKTDEVAILLLGTHRSKLWRSQETPAPFGTPGFLWANNNARDGEVRKEYAVQPDGAPFDAVFSPWNRDLAFQKFFKARRGTIDANAVVDLWATSPINRPHACDGKVTTSEMAEQLVFLAHQGKTTLREKFPQAGNRRMPDLPGALAQLSLGWTAFSPIVLTDGLKLARAAGAGKVAEEPKPSKEELGELGKRLAVDARRLWRGSLFPRSDADGWIASASAAYWQILHGLPEEPEKAARALRDELAGLDQRLLYLLSREEDLAPVAARRTYDRYGSYQIPRVKGTFALHQLRLRLGNEKFLAVMEAVHSRFAGAEISTADFLATGSKAAGRDLAPLIVPWIDRTGLPDPHLAASARKDGRRWKVTLVVTQSAPAWPLAGRVAIEAGGKRHSFPFEVEGERAELVFHVPAAPERLVFDDGRDLPVTHERFYSFASFADDFERTLLVYGTKRQIEANRTLATRFQTTLADAYSEILSPLVQDAEVSDEQLAAHDLVVLGSPDDNAIAARVAERLPGVFGSGFFRWEGKLHARPEDGLFLVLPNPWNPARALALVAGNSALELYQMTRSYTSGIPGWALFRGDEVKEKAPHSIERFVLDL